MVYDRLAGRLDDVRVVAAVQDASASAYLIAGALSLLAAALLGRRLPAPGDRVRRPRSRRPRSSVYAVEHDREAPAPATLAGPVPGAHPAARRAGSAGRSKPRRCARPTCGACQLGTSREELALALFDQQRAAAFERKYGGVNPRSVGGLLSLLGG